MKTYSNVGLLKIQHISKLKKKEVSSACYSRVAIVFRIITTQK